MSNAYGKIHVGLGSYSCRYAIGTKEFVPPQPMHALEFLHRAHELGFHGVQLCDNLRLSELNATERYGLSEEAEKLGMFVELGIKTRGKQLEESIILAQDLRAKLLRIVYDFSPSEYIANRNAILRMIETELQRALLRNAEGPTLALENHYGIPLEDLVKLVDRINNRQLQLVFDCLNSVCDSGFPEKSLKLIEGRLASLHIKDYVVQKMEAGYLVTGTVLGRGCLPVEKIVSEALATNPEASIILEMAILRNEESSIAEVLQWEKQAVEESSNYLLSTIRHHLFNE